MEEYWSGMTWEDEVYQWEWGTGEKDGYKRGMRAQGQRRGISGERGNRRDIKGNEGTGEDEVFQWGMREEEGHERGMRAQGQKRSIRREWGNRSRE
jgi:hypothetical protein